MYRIVGKDNLASVNEVAQRAMILLHNFEDSEEPTATIPLDTLLLLTSGYLYLYQVVLEEGCMPNTNSAKHNIFNLH